MRYSFTLDNLNCAHCAGKIESKIASTDGYEKVSFNFATKQLLLESGSAVTAGHIQSICDSVEYGVNVIDNSKKAEKDEGDGTSKKLDLALLIISALLGASALAISFTALSGSTAGKAVIFALSLCAAALAGYGTFIRGFKSVLKLRIDETALMSAAVIAAFILGEYVEGAMVTVLFALGELIEDKAVASSRRGIEKLAGIRPDTATLLTDGAQTVVPAEQVAVGSAVIVKPHERIPLDGVITKGKTTLDASALTGESLPVDAEEGSEVLSGTVNGSSLIEIRTTKLFGDSAAARILKLVEDAASKKGESEKFISRFASVYTPIVAAIAVLIALVPPLLGFGTFSDWIYRALVCLVASCPCAIVISVPLTFYSGIGAASKIGVLIKGGKYMEALAKADAFVFDKTGTLTDGKLSVTKVYAAEGYGEDEILALAASCERYSSHPIARAVTAKAEGLELFELENYSELAGTGIRAEYNGKELLCGGAKILPEGRGADFGENASVFIVLDSKAIGAISVSDSVREETKEVLSKLRRGGVKRTVMLTGDKKENAEKLAEELGLSDFSAELMPEDKLERLNAVKEGSKAVCFVGDGINDAPVLTASDCGFAMGFGSDAAIEAADAVLASDNLRQLPKALKIAKRVVSTVRTNVAFALLFKAAVIALAIVGIAPMWLSVAADTGVSVICVLYSARLLRTEH